MFRIKVKSGKRGRKWHRIGGKVAEFSNRQKAINHIRMNSGLEEPSIIHPDGKEEQR